jgi:hypothetical protein
VKFDLGVRGANEMSELSQHFIWNMAMIIADGKGLLIPQERPK